jgi:hypothetical protein
MTLPSRITVTPSVVTAPAWVLVCYDFKGATSPVTIACSPTGNGDETVEDLSAEEPCVQYHVPAGCTGVFFVDESEQSSDAALIVTP